MCMAAALGTLPFCLGRLFSDLSVYQGHLEGAPGKSGLHASGEGERVIALESW